VWVDSHRRSKNRRSRSRSNCQLGSLWYRAPGRNWELCRDEALAGVEVVLPGFVDNPEVLSARGFRVVAGLYRMDGQRTRIGHRGNQVRDGNDSLADRLCDQ
jgi:hypothetical protein